MALITVGQISIVDSNDGLSAQLSANSVLLPADKDGNVNSFVGAETTFSIFEGGIDMAARWGFYVSATGGGVSYRDINDAVNRTDLGPSNGVLDTNYLKVTSLSQASSYIDITATRVGSQDITRRFSIAKAVVGATGTRGTLTVSRAISGGAWVDADAATAISGIGGGSPLRGDVVTLYRTSPAFSETRTYNGSAWVSQAAYLAGSQIIDGSVNGNKITAGTIIGDRIAANTINVTKLAVADFSNLAANGDLTLGNTGWPGLTVTSDATNAYTGSWVIPLPASSTVNKYASNENVFAVKPGDSFYLEWWGKATSDMDSSFNVYLRVNNAAGAQIATSNVGSISSANTAYTMRSGAITMPANAYSAYLQVNWNNTVGTGYIGAVRMRRRNEGALIVDGTITGNKVAANTIVGDNIAANTINTKSLLIGDTTNFAENPDFGLGNVGWTIQTNSGPAVSIVQTADSYQGGWVASVGASANGALRNKATMRVKAGDQLLGYAIAKASGSVSAYPRICYMRADLSELSFDNATNFPANGAYQTSSINGIVPAGAVYARVEVIYITSTGATFTVGMGGLMRRMTGDLIVDGAITANKIDALAVQGRHIAGETITGDKIVAGTIKAAQIGAGEIVATKLAIGNSDNIIPDADFRDPASWGVSGWNGAELFDTTSPWAFFRRALRFRPNGATGARYGAMFPVEPGATYKIKVSTYIGPNFNYADGWFNPVLIIPAYQILSLKTFTTVGNPAIRQPESWTITTGNGVVDTREYVFTNPASWNQRQWQFRFDGNIIADVIEIAISVTRVSDATLIADGAITTNKITVNSLNADRLTSGTISGDKISTTASLPATVTVGTSGVSIETVRTQANDPAARVNANTTTIDPGKVLIQGSTSLNDWRDQTFIKGGAIRANSVSADKLNINSRGINSEGIDFEVKIVNGGPELSWSGGGYIQYMGDDGNGQSRQIAAGNTVGYSKRCFIYWIVGENAFRVETTAEAVMVNRNAVMIATYMGGNVFNALYGGTVINGSRITTGSIVADNLAVDAITARSISLGTITEGLVANGGAETGNTDGWTGQGFVLPGGNGSAYNHGQSPNSGTGYYSKAFPVTAGRTYSFGFDLYGTNAYFRVMWSSNKPAFNVATNTFSDLLVNGGSGNFWQSFAGAWTAPADARWVSIVLYNTGGANNIYWDNIQAFEQVTGVRIKDGTIDANKINVTSLSAVSANLGAITAGTISSKSGNTVLDFNNNTFAIDASEFRIRSGSQAAVPFELVNGAISLKNVAIDGGSIANVSIQTSKIVGNAVTTNAYATIDAGGTMGGFPQNQWVDFNTTSYGGGGSDGGGGGGSGGGGGACPVIDTPILLANAQRNGPGETTIAGDLRVNDWVWTQHETTMEWGAYRVTNADVVKDVVVHEITLEGKYLRASWDHPVWTNDRWATMAEISDVCGRADVMRITIDDAHTYISNGILSHNKVVNQQQV
jgi:hypothetical protein